MCAAGKYFVAADQECQACALRQGDNTDEVHSEVANQADSSADWASSEAECTCRAGFERVNDLCRACAQGKYRVDLFNATCLHCQAKQYFIATDRECGRVRCSKQTPSKCTLRWQIRRIEVRTGRRPRPSARVGRFRASECVQCVCAGKISRRFIPADLSAMRQKPVSRCNGQYRVQALSRRYRDRGRGECVGRGMPGTGNAEQPAAEFDAGCAAAAECNAESVALVHRRPMIQAGVQIRQLVLALGRLA